MDLTRLREEVGRFMHRSRNGHARLEQLLETLERKDAELQRRLVEEQDPQRRRHLEVELEVVRLQHQKGVARRLELEAGGR